MEKFPFYIYDEKNSKDFNIVVENVKTLNAPARDVTITSVPGRNGDLITDNGRFLNIDMTYEIAIRKMPNCSVEEIFNQLKTWLLSDYNYKKLIDSFDINHFRYARYAGGVEPTKIFSNIIKATITFNCKPFRYLTNEKIILVDNKSIIYNPENYFSLPHIKIYGSGDITLMINNSEYNFKGIEEYIELDSEILSAYKGLELQNSKMTSVDFPKLQPGSNNISWVGNVEKIEIIPRWRSL